MNIIERIKTVIEDFEMLKNGSWEPDKHSIQASIDNLDKSIEGIDDMCLKFADFILDKGYRGYSKEKCVYTDRNGKLKFITKKSLYKLFLEQLK